MNAGIYELLQCAFIFTAIGLNLGAAVALWALWRGAL